MVEEKIKKKRKDLLKEGAERPVFQGEGIRVETPKQFEERKEAESQLEPVPEPIEPAPASFEDPQVLEQRRAELQDNPSIIRQLIDRFAQEGSMAKRRPEDLERGLKSVGLASLGIGVGTGGAASGAGRLTASQIGRPAGEVIDIGNALTKTQGFKLGGKPLTTEDILKAASEAVKKLNKSNAQKTANKIKNILDKKTQTFIQRTAQSTGLSEKAIENMVKRRLAQQSVNEYIKKTSAKKIATIGAGAVGTAVGIASLEAAWNYFALDNVIGGHSLFTRDLWESVSAGNIDPEKALEEIEKANEAREAAISKVKTSSSLNPLMWPLKNLLLNSVEADQVRIDFYTQQIRESLVTREDFESRARNEFFDAQEPSSFEKAAQREDEFTAARQSVAERKAKENQ